MVTFETSPSTHTSKNSVSRTPCRRSVSWLTVQVRRCGFGFSAPGPKSSPFCCSMPPAFYGEPDRRTGPFDRTIAAAEAGAVP